jgi:hypothetical protein
MVFFPSDWKADAQIKNGSNYSRQPIFLLIENKLKKKEGYG